MEEITNKGTWRCLVANEDQSAPSQAMYLTDDRDLPLEDQRALVIFPGGNGDWYVQVTPHHGRSIEGVRLCTSGGASSACPGLTIAVAEAYRCMKAVTESGSQSPIATFSDMEEELHAWRARFPNQRYAFGEIIPNIK